MHLKSILNRVEPLKSFVYQTQRLVEDAVGRPVLEVDIEPRANSRPICSGCGKKRPGYDRLPARRFEFVPLWGMAVYLVYAMRRVNCPECGVVVEQVPWATGKCQLTTSLRWFLAGWAKRLSWQETADAFHTTWENVFRSVEHAVEWGLAHRELSGVEAIGVDEVQWRNGHTYLTLVYQIDSVKRLLWVAEERTEKSLRSFFESLTAEARAGIQFVASDMWKPYLKVIAEQVPAALHVLDRFHIMRNMNVAIDEVRRTEAARMKKDGYEPILTKARWCLLKRPENLTENQEIKLKQLLGYNLKSIRAYMLRELFQQFWDYVSPTWAGKFLDAWCTEAMRSKLEPMKKVAKSLRRHRHLILNWFRAHGTISAGVVEGLNGKVKLTTRKAYGFRTAKCIRIALFHVLGRLQEPQFTHR
ncbi:MAG: ISL3 family transposase, partial [Planctomycetia bacterium]